MSFSAPALGHGKLPTHGRGRHSPHDHAEQRRRDPPTRLRRVRDRPGAHQGRHPRRPRRRVPPHRHGPDVRQREAGGRGRPGLGPSPGRRLRHQQAEQPLPRLRRRAGGDRHDPRRPGLRPRRPVPDPLAAPRGRRLRRDVVRHGGDLPGRQGPGGRRLQLPGAPPPPAAGEERARPGGEPDRGPSLPGPGRGPGLRRRARHRHRGVVADRQGQGPRRTHDRPYRRITTVELRPR